MAESHPYRFALATLLKSPRAFGISTRRPSQVKNNYSLTLFLAFRPPRFPVLEPEVQALQFCESDRRATRQLCFSPWFLQKTPGNLVFLAEKPLNLVLSVVFAF